MSVSIEVAVESNEKVLAFLDDLAGAPEEGELWEVIGAAERHLVREHLFEKDGREPNKLGGARTHYYKGAAESADVTSKPGMATVSIGQVGLRLRLKGGVVRMKDKLLTIPADPMAHGKRAREFSDLVFVPRQGKTKGLLFLEDKLLYVLRSETTHVADPDVLPTEKEMQETATEATMDWLEEEFGDGVV